MFVQALGTPNTTVVLATDLDLSGLGTILITDGVQLIGGRTAVPGKPFHPGPLLYVTDHPRYLFEVQGDNVRISGVRIQGPDMGVSEADKDGPLMSAGIYITDVMPCLDKQPVPSTCVSPPASGHINVEIDHNEVSGWSNLAVGVEDRKNRIAVTMWIDHRTPVEVGYALKTEPVYIHDNFIHHNQHDKGLGYGVMVGQGAHALIERNVFDFNRHAITADATHGVGYRAYRNLVLENGGWQKNVGLWMHTQQFDMHGQSSHCLVGGPLPDHYCGVAGHDYDIRYNSFLYNAGPAIKLRGTPELGAAGAVIRFIVFAHDNEGDAVEYTEVKPVVQDNLTRVTSWGRVNTCDFDGDGIKDTFIATGQTLWYCPGGNSCVTSPGSGKPTWVYLNSSTKQVDELALGYFSGGPVCDVVDGGLISVGGWEPFSLFSFSIVRPIGIKR